MKNHLYNLAGFFVLIATWLLVYVFLWAFADANSPELPTWADESREIETAPFPE